VVSGQWLAAVRSQRAFQAVILSEDSQRTLRYP
jgi:hypothetical protein